jgi:GNAT superfamily N-acetyltransferase
MKTLANKYDVIFHSKEDEEFTYIYIMGRFGESFVRIYSYKDDGKVLYIDMLSVTESYRGNGYAKKLMACIEEIAEYLEIESIILWVKHDLWVHDWYGRLGFKDSAPPIHTHEGNTWMKKQLKQ